MEAGNRAFPLLYPHEGTVVDGVAVDLTEEEDFTRLSFFAVAIGAHPVPKHGEMGGGLVAGVAFVAGQAQCELTAWDQDTWVQAWGALAHRAVEEIMSYCGRLDPGELGWRMQMILARATAREQAAQHPAPAQVRSETSSGSVPVLGMTTPHEGFFLTRQYNLQPPRFDGRASPTVSREVFVATDAVIVLPYDPLRDRVLLVEQFRMGPLGRGDPRPWVLEPVAGRVDAGETVEAAARRECAEEAALDLHDLHHVSSHYCSPGCSTEFYHCYVATADLRFSAAGLGGLETENEDIRTHVLEFDAAMELVTSGEANIGPLVLLLLWLERERPRLHVAV